MLPAVIYHFIYPHHCKKFGSELLAPLSVTAPNGGLAAVGRKCRTFYAGPYYTGFQALKPAGEPPRIWVRAGLVMESAQVQTACWALRQRLQCRPVWFSCEELFQRFMSLTLWHHVLPLAAKTTEIRWSCHRSLCGHSPPCFIYTHQSTKPCQASTFFFPFVNANSQGEGRLHSTYSAGTALSLQEGWSPLVEEASMCQGRCTNRTRQLCLQPASSSDAARHQ